MGKTALIKAIRGNHYNIVHLLLNLGCDPNNGSPDNSFTPLSVAIEKGLLKIVRLLIIHRADPRHLLKVSGVLFYAKMKCFPSRFSSL